MSCSDVPLLVAGIRATRYRTGEGSVNRKAVRVFVAEVEKSRASPPPLHMVGSR